MINVFFSYSHADETLRNELEKHLTILRRQGIISTWHDRRIAAGSELDLQLNDNLKNADIILLLVSSDFLASDYCYNKEMQFAMERHEKGEAVVIPVILRPCDWQSALFGKLLATPKDGKAVSKFANYDDAFLEITEAIKMVIKNRSLVNERSTSATNFSDTLSIGLRSSNLRIAKKFTDHEKDIFLDEAFEYISKYFEGSLKELEKRNPEVSFVFKRLDSQSFSVVIYIHQSVKNQCMVYYGADTMFSKSISYSNTISANRNSLNESLSIHEDDNMLYLKPFLNMSMRQVDDRLTFEGAAEYFWGVFIEPLQRN